MVDLDLALYQMPSDFERGPSSSSPHPSISHSTSERHSAHEPVAKRLCFGDDAPTSAYDYVPTPTVTGNNVPISHPNNTLVFACDDTPPPDHNDVLLPDRDDAPLPDRDNAPLPGHDDMPPPDRDDTIPGTPNAVLSPSRNDAGPSSDNDPLPPLDVTLKPASVGQANHSPRPSGLEVLALVCTHALISSVDANQDSEAHQMAAKVSGPPDQPELQDQTEHASVDCVDGRVLLPVSPFRFIPATTTHNAGTDFCCFVGKIPDPL